MNAVAVRLLIKGLAALAAILLTVHLSMAAAPCANPGEGTRCIDTERQSVTSDSGKDRSGEAEPKALGHVALCKDHCASRQFFAAARPAVVLITYSFDPNTLLKGMGPEGLPRPPWYAA